MAYDSATDTALAGQAWQRALNLVAEKRARLSSSSGLNADGSLAAGEKGRLGSFYQGNLQSVMDEEGAEYSDRKRGFGGTGGLAGKARTRAHRASLDKQAIGLRDTFDQFGQLTSEESAANQDHTNEIGNIGLRSAAFARDWLEQHPVLAEAPAVVSNNPAPGYIPASPSASAAAAAARTAALKKNNPYATINNRF